MKENLTSIYEALCLIATKGNDTIIMGQCLSALSSIINVLPEEPDMGEE